MRAVLAARWAQPQASFSGSFEAWAPAKGAYALIEHPRADVSLARLLAPHAEATQQRMAAEPLVLLPQDTTTLTFTGLRQWAVWVREVDAPAGVELSEWMLLTDLPVREAAQAWEKVSWYGRRWGIEEWHRALKRGCGARSKKTSPPPPDLTLAAANRLAARLGGYAGRAGDGEPGAERVGLGLHRWLDMVRGWRIHSDLRHSSNAARRCV